VDFRRVAPLAAVRAFRRGELDEAPVPLGDIVATKEDPRLGSSVRSRTLLGLDVLRLSGLPQRLRQVYWETANRSDYEQLIPELGAAAAYGVLGGEGADPAAYRSAVRSIPELVQPSVRLELPREAPLRYGTRLLYGQWRDVGLGPRLVAGGATSDGVLVRLLAAYPQEEALPAQLVLELGAASRGPLLRAIGSVDEHAGLEQLDEELKTRAAAIPVAWVVDARLVSPRLDGWGEDSLGNVDYAAVRSRASSRRP
jgi:hypothetical protein